jgi:hypothetical protein
MGWCLFALGYLVGSTPRRIFMKMFGTMYAGG